VSLLAAHLNDAGISVLSDERLLYREPGYALLEDDELVTGNAALAAARLKPRRIQNHYWDQLATEPLADRRFSHLSTADLVSQQLEHIWKTVADHGDRLVVAVPPYMSSDNLGLFLGIAGELGVPVVAMVDAAVAATRREYRDAVPVHVDLSLHGATLSRLSQSGQAQLDRSEIVEASGLLALLDAWLRGIAEAFVQQSRFDPLHTAETEQLMLDRMSGWLASASSDESVTLQIEYRGISHAVELDSLELVSMAAPAYQRIINKLRALYRADETPAIQLSDRAARMPGLAEMMSARVGGEVFLLEPGATARGVLARCRDVQRDAGGVSLIRSLPWDQSAVSIELETSGARAGQPTHLLFGNTAYALDQRHLYLGTQAESGARSIDLRQDMPGVSRRHCSLRQQNGQCVIEDFSRYGTFLNGHRIDGSAVLAIGDQVRIGTPGFELRLITLENVDGS
jgi:hypothetical protein